MWSNSDFKTWIGDVNAMSLSQDVLKEEAVKFSPVFAGLDKKTVLKRVEDFLKSEKKMVTQATLLRNQIQPKRSATDQFSSNYYILHIYMSF